MTERSSRQNCTSYCRIENFLADRENRRFLEEICRDFPRFEPSSTTTGKPNYRKSLVYYPSARRFPKFLESIESCLPFVTRALGKRRLAAQNVDLQVTAHNDGDFFRIHRDRGHGKGTRNRAITFVYYLHRQPKPFTGGELIIRPSSEKDRRLAIEPANNTIVFFRSEQEHAVRRIRCASGKFEDSRFTINGWICR